MGHTEVYVGFVYCWVMKKNTHHEKGGPNFAPVSHSKCFYHSTKHSFMLNSRAKTNYAILALRPLGNIRALSFGTLLWTITRILTFHVTIGGSDWLRADSGCSSRGDVNKNTDMRSRPRSRHVFTTNSRLFSNTPVKGSIFSGFL